MVFAFSQVKISLLLPLGLLLFLLCDTLIGLNEMSQAFIPLSESSFAYKIINSGINLAWVFYVPSQTLLAISVNDEYLQSSI